MRTLAFVSLLALASSAFGQSAETPLQFEIADVRITGQTTFRGMNGPFIRATRYEVRNATMVDLIRTAYDVESDFVYGGPSWMGSVHFDVTAKVPPNTPYKTTQLMLQDLLANRFALKVHRDKKPVSVFVLSMGKGKPRLKPATGTDGGCRNPNSRDGAPPPPPPPGEIPYIQVSCQNLTAADIVITLHQMAAGYLTRAVVDTTKLEGAWDFDLKWTDRNSLPNAGSDGISIFDAVDRQLGLKLELQTPTMDVIAVDSVNEKPTANAEGVADAIPEPPKEFEVASIKPSAPDSPPGTRIRFMAGGRVDAEASLKDLIIFALDVPPVLAADLLVGGPDFLATERYAIVAKAPLMGGPQESFPPINELQGMLRALIIDQFNLKTHIENRETSVFALIAPKPETKLKKADPSARGNCVLDVASGKAIGTPGAYLCQNTTMAELAKLLQERANAYTVHPVVDLTGIAGGWDFSIGWTPLAQLRAENAAGMTVFEGVEKMLGLKLEQQKRSIPVTVIDHVDPKPKQ